MKKSLLRGTHLLIILSDFAGAVLAAVFGSVTDMATMLMMDKNEEILNKSW
jgi:hypothetical protein